ncbi:MAG TPA: hypothetical protein VMW65_07545, partial [Chloroflexota bacterium]|nr:hypothetical protein [Chloroflexota bacterium]
GVETAQGVVAGEREAYESALGELEKIDQDSAQLPDVGEERLSAVEEVVRSWDTASQRQSDLDNALAEARQRLESKELVAAERLSNLGSDTTADDLGAAIRSIETASQRLSDARADQERVTLAPADEIEYDRLSQQIGELTGTSLGELEQRAHRLELARQQNAASGSQTPLLVGLAILVGFGLGFALLGGLGAAIGAVIGGIVGFLVAGALIKTGRGSESQMVAKNADLLAADLKRYGVESIGELRALWDRRNELVGKVNQIRASRTRINERQADLKRALAGLVQVAGTRDLEQASQLERELRQDQLDLQNLRQGFADAERLMVDAAKEAAARSAEARRQLVLLGIAVENPSEAHRALGQIRATQVKRRDLLQRKAELSGEVQLYAAREDALERCQSELDGCDARLASAFEKVGLVLPLADPAMSLAEVHGRFGKYQDLRTREQNLGASRDALIGGDDPADWLRQKEMLAERAGSADLVDERSREELEAHRAAVRRERDVKTRLLSDVEAKLAAAMRQIREPSIIEEELAEAERRYRELDRLKNALEGAKQALTQVTVDFQRDFAPRLESRVGKTLAQITAGRYGEVSIDPVDLAIRINSFERTDLVELDGLSHGTRDAIALLLRASVAQLLSNNAEPVPLFLDDPLVHVDSDRTRRVFDVLQELSEEWQIFYFTQDERVVEWARRSGGSVKLCELPPPSPRSAVS